MKYVTMGVILTALGGYVLTSIILLKFPNILHKKKKNRFRAVHISHRGGAGERLENTIAAFKHAESCGTEMLEIDVHITRDREVVVSHDSRLARSTGEDVMIADTLYNELPQLKSSLQLDFQADHICVSTDDDRKIPLLRTVFQEFPHMPINIDVKVNDDDLITKTNELIREFKREEITVWGNFQNATCQKLHTINPSVGLFFSLRRILLTTFLFYTGLLPFIPLTETHYEMLMPSIAFKENRFRLIKLTPRRWCYVWGCHFILMSKVLIWHLKARGIKVYLWVLNEDDEYERAFELGADGVMTDFPTRLQHYLQRNPRP